MKVIGTYGGGFQLVEPTLGTSPEGWDEVREVIWADTANGYTTGASRSFADIAGTFFISSARVLEHKACKPVLEIVCLGVAGTKPVQWKATAYTETVNSNVAGVPGAHTSDPVPTVVRVAKPGVVARYISTTAPSSAVVGTAVVPATTYGVPDYPFASASNDLIQYNWPHGWILDKRDSDALPGTSYHLVADYFIYQWFRTVKAS